MLLYQHMRNVISRYLEFSVRIMLYQRFYDYLSPPANEDTASSAANAVPWSGGFPPVYEEARAMTHPGLLARRDAQSHPCASQGLMSWHGEEGGSL